jgi:basic membrane protein A and related proteins
VAAALLAVAITAASAGSKRPVRVGLVLNDPLSRVNDPAEYDAYRGLLRATRLPGVQAKAVVPLPNVVSDPAPFNYLAERQYDLVIAIGGVGGLSEAGRRFRNVNFAALDAKREELQPAAPADVEGTDFHSEQAAYLAGFVAARMAHRRRGHVISVVGGVPTPQVLALVAGFQAGAKHADRKIAVLKNYTYNFVVQSYCKDAALRQIADGSKVVFDAAGACGFGALDAAKSRGVYGVGVDTDMSGRGSYILTSVVLNWSRAVYQLAKLVSEGRFQPGGNLSLDMAHGFVGLGKFSDEVRPSLRRQLIPLRWQIEHGKIVVPTTVNVPH